jgi:type I restriction-modification system DNA methylase subunit
LALKNELHYKNSTTKQIIAGIEEILEKLLDKDWEKRTKLTIIYNDVLDAQEVKELKDDIFIKMLDFINENIIPFINDKTNQGQDLLNLFFTTFNKYTGKDEKNQAFTPSHIVHFMCKIAKIDRNSVVLDPTCGSGAFLVQAMTQALENCRTKEERESVKKHQIYGIEKEHKAYGLSVTNMLIHSDGNSNIKDKSCFERFKEGFIDGKGINVVLMNPPYNATLKDVPDDFSKTWKKQKNKNLDPTKGFYFVYETAKAVKNGILLCLLPLACAIGSKNSKEIIKYKKKMLEENTLNAVFTLPPDMFHPGANVNACCMVFTLGKPHPKDYETFFGYYKNDGFVKKKNLGRVDVKNQWDEIEKEWIYLYENRIEKPGMSVKHNIAIENHSELYKKEWLAEAYMKTDYSKLNDKDFENVIRSYIAYKVGNIQIH